MEWDYADFVVPSSGGGIWWRLEDAVKLCAGFRPQEGGGLVMASKEAQRAQREILAALHHQDPVLQPPRQIERDNEFFVDAQSFVDWLSAARVIAGLSIRFPIQLARQIAARQSGSEGKASAIFESLQARLEGQFERELPELPEDLQEAVRDAFFPFSWEWLSPPNRESVAIQWDERHDPAKSGINTYWWNFYIRKGELEKEREEATTAHHRGLLDSELARMDSVVRKARARDESPRAARVGPKPSYIAYPRALAILQGRFDATAEEVAAWILLDKENGGLDAYLNGNEFEDPPRFQFSQFDQSFDYIGPLMGCWFLQGEIESFKPKCRFITGAHLLERWASNPVIRPREFLVAKIQESRLLDMHPIYGLTEGSRPGANYPPLESALFDRGLVEAIEAEDFPAELEPDTAHLGPAVSAVEIIRAFEVFASPAKNDEWWRKKMRAASDSQLKHCRVGAGKHTPGGTLWRPVLVAHWLVQQQEKGKQGLSPARAKAALAKIPGCESLAHDGFPDAE